MKKNLATLFSVICAVLIIFGTHTKVKASEQVQEKESQLVFLQNKDSSPKLLIVDSKNHSIIKDLPLSELQNVDEISVAKTTAIAIANNRTEAYKINLTNGTLSKLEFVNPDAETIEKVLLTDDANGLAWSTYTLSYLGILKSKVFISDIQGTDSELIIEEIYRYKQSPENAYALAPLKWSPSNEFLYFEKFVLDKGPARKTADFVCAKNVFSINSISKKIEKISKQGECINDISDDNQLVGVTEYDENAIYKQLKIRNIHTNEENPIKSYNIQSGNFQFQPEDTSQFAFTSIEKNLNNIPVYITKIGNYFKPVTSIIGYSLVSFIEPRLLLLKNSEFQYFITNLNNKENRKVDIPHIKFVGKTSGITSNNKQEDQLLSANITETHKSTEPETVSGTIIEVTEESDSNSGSTLSSDSTYTNTITNQEPETNISNPNNIDSLTSDTSITTINSAVEDDTNEYPLSDIEGHMYEREILYLQRKGIISGYDDGTYKPDNDINRAEFTKIIIKSSRENVEFGFDSTIKLCFPDVTREDWYYTFVCYAKEKKIISGYPNGSFQPNQLINSAESLKIVLETFRQDLSAYIEGNSNWYDKYWNFAVAENILPEDVLYPDQYLTRGQMAHLIYRVIEL